MQVFGRKQSTRVHSKEIGVWFDEVLFFEESHVSRSVIENSVVKVPAGYLSFGPIGKILCFCDVSVREKDWQARPLSTCTTH